VFALHNGECLAGFHNSRTLPHESVMTSGMRMDVAEVVVVVLLAIWGPPLLFVAFLLRPIKIAGSRPKR
jgi:hypothetical protein